MMFRWIWVVLVVSSILSLTAWRAMTYDSSSQPVTLGLVNMEKLVANYQALKQDDEQYRQTVQRRQKMLEARAFLEGKEWEELDDLEKKEVKGKLNDAERKRME